MSMEELPADVLEGSIPDRLHGEASASQAASTFFSTPELRQRLDLLRHLTDNSEKILLIKGVDGSGKSTLLQQYRILARDEWMVCCLTADPMLQPDQFYSLLFRRFGLTDSTTANINGLLKRFEMLHAAGRLPVIVVDDAHLMPVATLIALFRLFERRPGNRALIRVVLFATPDINNHFQMPQVQAMNLQIVQSLDMPLFDRDQAQAFMEFQLAGEGRPQGLKLAAGRIERIVRESAGVPGLLEAQLHTVFAEDPDSGQQPSVTPLGKRPIKMPAVLADLPLAVLVGAPLLALLLLLTLVFQDEINQLFDQNSTAQVAEEPVSVREDGLRPLKLPELTKNLQQPRTVSEPVEQASPFEFDNPPAAASDLPDVTLPERGVSVEPPGKPPTPEPEMVETAPAARDAEPVEPPVPTDAAVNAPTDAPEQDSPVESVTAADTPVAERAADTASNAAVQAVEAAPAQVAVKASENPPALAELQDDAPPVPAGQPVTGVQPIKDEKWILTQRPEAYTLQLVGVQDAAAARGFITRHQLTGQATYFRTIRAGQPWFSVIFGVYPDRSAAIKGRDQLPPSLRKSEPWPRTYASIQAAIGQ